MHHVFTVRFAGSVAASSRSSDLESGNDTVHEHRHQPHTTPNQSSQPPQPSHGASNYGDSSWPLFSMYSEIAQKEDEKMVELWKTDADRILIMIGLFSAVVATLLGASLSGLKPNPEDTSTEILRNIYQVLADPNVTRPSNISIPPFSPSESTINVNSAWALSLVISLTNAVLATMLQQWARQYIKNSQRHRLSPEERARTHAFFAKAVKELRISKMVEVLPALLHISIFFFFYGFVIFFKDINSKISKVANLWIYLFSSVYLVITILPIVRPSSPYFTPLSTTAWSYWALIQGLAFKLRSIFRPIPANHYYTPLLSKMIRWRGQEAVLKLSSSLDVNILDRMVYAIGEDDTLEKFFDVIPGFFASKPVKGFRGHFFSTVSEKFQEALRGFLRYTLSSNTIPESVKTRRLDICMNAMNAIRDSEADQEIFNDILYGRLGPVPQSIETGHAMARWCRSNKREIAVPTRCIIAKILVNVRERDERWVALANDQFDLPENLVRDNITYGDNSVLLSILIHIARQAIRSGSLTPGILSSLSKFSIHDTAPGLQQDFCTLWNEVVQAPRTNSIPADILDEIRDLYIALHQGTEVAPTQFPAPIGNDDNLLRWPWSYSLCTIASHRPGITDREPPPFSTVPPQPGDSPDALPHSNILESQATPSNNITRIQAERARSTSSVHAAPRISLVTDYPIPENIWTAEVHEDTRDQDPLAPPEDPRHSHQSALSPAETVALASVVPSDNPSPPIRTDEAGEASQAPATTSLNFPRTGPDVSAFSVPEPIHISPHRVDGSSPSDLASDL